MPDTMLKIEIKIVLISPGNPTKKKLKAAKTKGKLGGTNYLTNGFKFIKQNLVELSFANPISEGREYTS